MRQLMVGKCRCGSNAVELVKPDAAVNLAARIEKLSSELGRTIMASDEFARHCSTQFMPVGEFELRGFSFARPVFGLAEEANPTEQHSA